MNSDFKQRPLKSMNKALEKAGNLLSEVNDDRARCLDVVSECQEFISWLSETIKGRKF